mgnify:FL=1
MKTLTNKINLFFVLTMFAMVSCKKDALSQPPVQGTPACATCPQNQPPVVVQQPVTNTTISYTVNKVLLAQDISSLPQNYTDETNAVYSDFLPMDGYADGTRQGVVIYYWAILVKDVVTGYNAQGQVVNTVTSSPYYALVRMDDVILGRLKNFSQNNWNVVKFPSVIGSSALNYTGQYVTLQQGPYYNNQGILVTPIICQAVLQ